MSDITALHNDRTTQPGDDLEERFYRASNIALALFDLLSEVNDDHQMAPGTLRKAGNSGYYAIQEAVHLFEELARSHQSKCNVA